MNPFDYVNAILQNKKQLIVDEITEKEYTPFLVNRSLSYHKDCIMYANEMNRRHFLDKKLQSDFLIIQSGLKRDRLLSGLKLKRAMIWNVLSKSPISQTQRLVKLDGY